MKLSRFHTALIAASCVVGAHAAPQQPLSTAATCVALTVPTVQGVDGDATGFAMGVRDLFATYLKGPTIRTEALESRLASQAVIEARGKTCGQMLLVSVTRKRSSNNTARILGQAAGIAATRAPVVGAGSVGAAASTATWTGGETVYRFASEIRAKDELELSYRLGVPDTVEKAKPVTAKAKAKSDGEDLLTPLVEKAANNIANAVTAGERK
jgi:hypothetical protein